MTTSLPTYEEILNVWFHEKYTDKPFSKLWFTTPNSTNQINAVSLLHNIYIYIYSQFTNNTQYLFFSF